MPAAMPAQTATASDVSMSAILARLDKIERQNAELTAEIQSLRTELALVKTQPPLEDRVAVVENRVEEQAQSKVQSSQRFPVSVNGLLLFNAFTNGRSTDELNATSYLLGYPQRSGATLGQTLLGFDFDGPEIAGGGKISASLNLDFLGSASTYGYALRIRRGVVNFDWGRRSLTVGEDKPLISRRQPDSLAEVAYPALSDGGNPWIWTPQARYVEHFHAGENAGLDAEVSLLETQEDAAFSPGLAPYDLEATRPGLEGRVNFWGQAGESRLEIATGFHTSDTHVNGFSVPSRFGTVDWLIRPSRWIEVTGLFAAGRNMANLGGFTDGFTVLNGSAPRAVANAGGWTQVAFRLTPRLTLNMFGGMQAPRISDLGPGALTHEAEYAGNLIYRLGPNVLLGAEALQERTGYLDQSHALRNHYDLAIGYLF